jgi:2-polyprenyl-3-methyl-5-hydroxy-6-metoxy-1,4-benzoquinol methylase
MSDKLNITDELRLIMKENKFAFLNKNFLYLCKDKRVLEVGCFEGWISAEIMKHNPCELIMLEANADAAAYTQQKMPESRVIVGDMHEDLDQVGPVDVVLLLGVIYHSHAPLHILEQMVNHNNPNIVIIDNPGNTFEVLTEVPNRPGYRYVTDGRQTCQLVLNISEEIIILAMKNLGYKLIVQMKYPVDTEIYNAPIFYFEKV